MPGTPAYVELHAHSAYSLLDGASLPEELLARASELGYTAMALTDHDSLAGAIAFAMAARETSTRAILGTELTVQVGSEQTRHLTLLVRDIGGWRSICRLVTEAHAHTRDTPDRRAQQPSVPLSSVLEHSQGLVCLTGCAEHGVRDERTMRLLAEAFGAEQMRVELQRPYACGDRERNRHLERLAARLRLRTVATGDVHAHTPARARLQDVFTAIRYGTTLDGCEALRRPNHTHVLAGPQAMAARFSDHPDAVAETVRLAETLQFSLTGDLGYRYPGSDSRRATHDLAALCQAQFASRYPLGNRGRAQAEGRLEAELRIIEKLGLAGFFLLHHEILSLAGEVAAQVRRAGTSRALLPPGRGRGSSVSSIVCYLTGLSHIDPIANHLAIGRFLHEDLTGLPDIDIDFPRDIRERLIPTIHERYGPQRTALVAAFATYRARGAIRDLGKALGLPPGEIERVARASEGHSHPGGVAEDIASVLGRERTQSGRWMWLAHLADEAHGLPRHISQHPGGMILSTRPLIDCCPIIPAAMQGRQVVQWDKDSCADAGFLKIDLLGLGMLSAVERCVDLIATHRDERIDLSRIPYDDEATFHCIQEADTTGVFQIESRAQMGSLRRTRPATLQDLTIQVALVRPGPIVGGAVNPYIERRQRLLRDPDYEIPHLHPSLREPLKETLGTIIFQDQVIEVARAFAGFSAGEAEGLRRAMSRKRSVKAMEGHRQRFIEGAHRTHPDAPPQTVEQVWRMVAGFAGFGFPKSHGAAFGLLAYQSTWLRVHYPAEFLCSLLNEQPMGFYPPDSLIHEAQQRGVKILPPDVNHSELHCEMTSQGEIRLGLRYVKGLPERDVLRMLSSREQIGPFGDLEDLAARSGLTRSSLETLAWSGACDALIGPSRQARRTALWKLGIPQTARRLPDGDQLALQLGTTDTPEFRELSDWEVMIADYSSTGVSIDRHPLALMRKRLTEWGVTSTRQLRSTPHGTQITIGGMVIARQRPSTANGITFLLIEDEYGTLNVIVPRGLYERCRLLVRTEPLLLTTGTLERRWSGGGAINLMARQIVRLQRETDKLADVTYLADRTPQAAPEFTAVAPPSLNFGQGRRR